jgi:hypothetical protein
MGRDVPVRHPRPLVAGKRSQDLDVVLGGYRHQLSMSGGWAGGMLNSLAGSPTSTGKPSKPAG